MTRSGGPRSAVLEWLAALPYAAMSLLMAAIARVWFRRVDVVGRTHARPRGPLLVVANHPASWTDVIVLDVALRRKLHFLARDTLFSPGPRALLMRLYGALPLHPSGEGPEAARLNRSTFDRCHALFARGRAVAVFPEGVSASDRAIAPLRPGAARLALERAARPPAGPPPVIPVGLHYAARTRFRSDVVVSLGAPLDLADFRERHARDPEGAALALVGEMRAALAGLTLELPDRAASVLLPALAALGAERGPGAAARALERDRRRAVRLERVARADPGRVESALHHARVLRRAVGRLGVGAAALVEAAPARAGAAGFAVLALGIVPAAVGVVANGAPAALAAWIGRRLAPEAQRLAFGRMVCGVVLVPLGWIALGWLVARSAGARAWAGFAAAALAAACGAIALAWGERVRPAFDGARLARLARTHPRLVARARGAAAALGRLAAELDLPAPGGSAAAAARGAP